MNNKKAIRYLSLAAKAGKLVSGMDDCEKSIKTGRGGLLILAADAGGNTVRRARALSDEKRVAVLHTAYSKSELSAAIGRGSAVSLVLVTDGGLAEAFASAHALEQEERI